MMPHHDRTFAGGRIYFEYPWRKCHSEEAAMRNQPNWNLLLMAIFIILLTNYLLMTGD